MMARGTMETLRRVFLAWGLLVGAAFACGMSGRGECCCVTVQEREPACCSTSEEPFVPIPLDSCACCLQAPPDAAPTTTVAVSERTCHTTPVAVAEHASTCALPSLALCAVAVGPEPAPSRPAIFLLHCSILR